MTNIKDIFIDENEKVNVNQILQILEANELIDTVEPNIEEGKLFARFVQFGSKYNKTDFENIIKWYKKFYTLVIDAGKNVTWRNLIQVIDKYDKKLVINIVKANHKFRKEAAISKPATKKIIDEMLDYFESKNNKLNTVLKASSEDLIRFVDKTMYLKNTIIKHETTKDELSKVFDNCVLNIKEFWRKTKVDDLDSLLKTLTTHIYDNTTDDIKLSSKEIVALSDKCASFYMLANDRKVNDVANVLMNYKEYLLNTMETKVSEEIINLVKETDVKQILINSPSIFTENASYVQLNLNLLSGMSFKDAMFATDKLGAEAYNYKNIYNLKINASTEDMARIFTTSITSLGISPACIEKISTYVNDAFVKAYGEPNIYDTVLSGKNFTQLSRINLNKIYKNDSLSVLTKFLSRESLLRVLNNDITVLNLSQKNIEKSLSEVLLNAKDKFDLETKIIDVLSDEVKLTNKATVKHKNIENTYGISKKILFEDNANESLNLNLTDYIKMLDALNFSEEQKQQWITNFEAQNAEYLELERLEKLEAEQLKLNRQAKQMQEQKEATVLNMASEIEENLIEVCDNAKIKLKNLTSFDNSVQTYKEILTSKNQIQININNNYDDLEQFGLVENLEMQLSNLDSICTEIKENILNQVTISKEKVKNAKKEIEAIQTREKKIEFTKNKFDNNKNILNQLKLAKIYSNVMQYALEFMVKTQESYYKESMKQSDFPLEIWEKRKRFDRLELNEPINIQYRLEQKLEKDEIQAVIEELNNDLQSVNFTYQKVAKPCKYVFQQPFNDAEAGVVNLIFTILEPLALCNKALNNVVNKTKKLDKDILKLAKEQMEILENLTNMALNAPEYGVQLDRAKSLQNQYDYQVEQITNLGLEF